MAGAAHVFIISGAAKRPWALNEEHPTFRVFDRGEVPVVGGFGWPAGETGANAL